MLIFILSKSFFLLKNQALCVYEFCRLLEWSVVQVRRSGSSDPVWVYKLTMTGCFCVMHSSLSNSLSSLLVTLGLSHFIFSSCVYHYLFFSPFFGLCSCRNPTLAKCGGEAQHLEKLEVWSPSGLPNVQSSTARGKTLCIGVFLVSLERS